MTQPVFWKCWITWNFSFLQSTRKIEWFLQHLITITFSKGSKWFSKVPIATVWAKPCCCYTIILTSYLRSLSTQSVCFWWESCFSGYSCTGHLMCGRYSITCFTSESTSRPSFRIGTWKALQGMRGHNFVKDTISWWLFCKMQTIWEKSRKRRIKYVKKRSTLRRWRKSFTKRKTIKRAN